jgi:dihydrolipoamide dehydrogenase
VCLNWGCIPTKALLRNAEVVHLFHRAEEFGITLKGF